MNDYINWLLNRTRNFGLIDFAVFKTNLILLGIILGVYFQEQLIEKTLFIWILLLSSFLYVLYCTFVKKQK